MNGFCQMIVLCKFLRILLAAAVDALGCTKYPRGKILVRKHRRSRATYWSGLEEDLHLLTSNFPLRESHTRASTYSYAFSLARANYVNNRRPQTARRLCERMVM